MFGIEREIPFLSEYGIFFSLYVFHMKLRLSQIFRFLYFIGFELQMVLMSLQS